MSELVLVTGGAGFIGSHTCEALLAAGYRVRVLDNLSSGRYNWVPDEAEFTEGDITDNFPCWVGCLGADYVIHLAAFSRSAPSMNKIYQCTQANVLGTQNMLIAAQQAGVKKFVYAGSATWYGNQRLPVHGYNLPKVQGWLESAPPDFLNPYALSKGVGEQYALAFDKFYGLPVTVLRYFNVYGSRQPTDGDDALVIGAFVDRALHQQALTIHGDGTQKRDFVHVRDVARANVLAIQNGHHGLTCNIGSGQSVSINWLANVLSSDLVYTDRRPGDAQETLADIRLAAKVLGWQPEVTLTEGLKELLDE